LSTDKRVHSTAQEHLYLFEELSHIAAYKMAEKLKNEVSEMKLFIYGRLICLLFFFLMLSFTGNALAQLPAEWSRQDIGEPSIAGVAVEQDNEWIVSGDGSDISSRSDSFCYVYRTVLGDSVMTARIVSIENTNDWAKAGLMIRERLDANSKHAFMALTPSGGTTFMHRSFSGQSTNSSNSRPGKITLPCWIRLVRQGSTFTGYYSTDGINWIAQPNDEFVYPDPQGRNPATIDMPQTVYMGLAVTSRRDGIQCRAVFDNLTIIDSSQYVQPDLQIRIDDEFLYAGDDIYNDLSPQTKSQTIGEGMVAVYDIKLENERFVSDRFIITCSAPNENWDVKYYDNLSRTDITDAVTGPGWSSPVLPSGGCLELMLDIRPGPNIPDGSMLEELVTAVSSSDLDKIDMVKAVTTFTVSIPSSLLGRIYTINEDFHKGTLISVEYETVPDQLQLSSESTTLPFIWVPNSNEGTVSKVDTRTGRELGRYCTGPGSNGNPSRTTVDLFGNCWVGNRNTGTVVKIGLLENGQYMDRNWNGVIETSRDLDGDGQITGDELLPWASDECVIYEVVLIPGAEGTYIPGQYQGAYTNDSWEPGPRGIAVDKSNNIWAGCSGSMMYYYIRGSDGEILKTIDVSSVSHTPYGAVVDENGILWSSGHDKGYVLRLDPIDDSISVVNFGHFSYGLGLDRFGHLFVSGWTDSKLSRINIQTGKLEWTRPGVYESRGVACTDDGDVWTADSSPSTVTRWSNDGIKLQTIPVGNTPTGVVVDADGKVWVVDNGDGYISRINTQTNLIDLSKNIIGTRHYGYSDMTGIISRTFTTKTGSWTIIHNTRIFDSQWGLISWNSYEPAGTSLAVKTRSSNDRRSWSIWEEVENDSPLHNTPNGRYLEMKVVFQSEDQEVSPVLYDLTVNPLPYCGDLDHPYLLSDLNKDCKVDFMDFTIMAAQWLHCTAPECD
jgi:DNA-binding beta-propeller fold protein YncE